MGTYDRQIATAKRLIAKYGQTVTISQTPVTIADVNKPWEVTLGVPVITNIKMVFFSPKLVNKEFLRYIVGTELKSGNVQGLMAADSVIPKATNIITRNNIQMKIKSIDILAPNEQTILYTIEFEK